MKQNLSSEEREKHMAKALWLYYFNRYLFSCKVITDKEYKQMIELIAQNTNVELRVRP